MKKASCQFINTKTKCGKPANWRSTTGTFYCDAHKKELEKCGMKLQKVKG